MDFKTRLKEELNYTGLTLKELSAKTGIPKRTLDAYSDSRSRIPPADVAVKIAEALHVSVEYLVTGNDSKISNDEKVSMKFKAINQKLDKLSDENWEKLEPLFNAMIESELKSQK